MENRETILNEVKTLSNKEIISQMDIMSKNHEQLKNELKALIEIFTNLEDTYAIYAEELKKRTNNE